MRLSLLPCAFLGLAAPALAQFDNEWVSFEERPDALVAGAISSTSIETDPVTFTATASDTESGDLTASITWSSDLDGVLERVQSPGDLGERLRAAFDAAPGPAVDPAMAPIGNAISRSD